MSRPKGSTNKKKIEVVAPIVPQETKPEVKHVRKEEVKETKEVKLEPLGPGQRYFEASDGTILIGEADKNQLWYRNGDGGKGCWINPKR